MLDAMGSLTPPVRARDRRPMLAMFRMTVTGQETAFVRKLTGDEPWDTHVQICLDQLMLQGEYSAVRGRLEAVLELLDDIAAHPDDWQDLCWQRSPTSSEHAEPSPHPFIRQPPTIG